MRLLTDVELAERFGIKVDELHALRKRHGWPCVKLGRFHVRFTEDQVAEIVTRHTETRAMKPASPARALPGQTKLSAARSGAQPLLDEGRTWFNTTQAGERAHLHPTTVLRACESGALHGRQRVARGSWRIHVDCLEAWIRGEKCEHQR